jgi:hypothetical protein
MPLEYSEIKSWLARTNLSNKAAIARNGQPSQVWLDHLAYEAEDDRINILKTKVDARIFPDGRIQSIAGISSHVMGVIVPLSPNAAITTLSDKYLKGEFYFHRSESRYIWFPEGVQAVKNGPYLTYYPDQYLLHINWRNQAYMFKARVPEGYSCLDTFYPEIYTQHAFREHPECWLMYWNNRLVNLSSGNLVHSWNADLGMPKPEEFWEFLAKRITRTAGGSFKSVFTMRAMEAMYV